MSDSRRIWTDFQTSRIISGAVDWIAVPYGWRPSQQGKRRCAIWCHGSGGDYHTGLVENTMAGLVAGTDFLNTLWLMTTLGDTTSAPGWAGDAALDKIDAVHAWAVTNFDCDSSKFILWGGSMGGATTARYCIERPAKIARAAAAIPAWDLEYVRANNIVGTEKAHIEAIWGVGTVPSAGQIKNRGAELTIPSLFDFWYSGAASQGDTGADVYTPLASSQKFATDSGVPGHYMGSLGHTYEFSITPQDVIDHLKPGVYA